MFDIINNIMNTPATPIEYANLNDNIFLNPEQFTEKLSNIDSLSDLDLMDVVKKSYSYILEQTYNKNCIYVPLFTNKRFVESFLQIIRSVSLLDSQRTTINKICYDYLTLHDKDEQIVNILFNMSKIVNQNVLPGLLGLGLNEQLSDYLALSRFSSTKELINVKRVNFIIQNQPSQLMTEQMIVNIYCKLFDSVSTLFTGTIVDYDEFTEEEEDISLVYSTISNAVLDILETLTLEQIRQVLLSYNITRESYYSGKKMRFTMNALSDDYNRINIVIESLKQEGVILP